MWVGREEHCAAGSWTGIQSQALLHPLFMAQWSGCRRDASFQLSEAPPQANPKHKSIHHNEAALALGARGQAQAESWFDSCATSLFSLRLLSPRPGPYDMWHRTGRAQYHISVPLLGITHASLTGSNATLGHRTGGPGSQQSRPPSSRADGMSA